MAVVTKEEILRLFETLTPEHQRSAFDFIEFLASRQQFEILRREVDDLKVRFVTIENELKLKE